MTREQIEKLAYDAANRFYALKYAGDQSESTPDRVIDAFSFRGCAVVVNPITNGFSLCIFDKEGRMLTNIAA